MSLDERNQQEDLTNLFSLEELKQLENDDKNVDIEFLVKPSNVSISRPRVADSQLDDLSDLPESLTSEDVPESIFETYVPEKELAEIEGTTDDDKEDELNDEEFDDSDELDEEEEEDIEEEEEEADDEYEDEEEVDEDDDFENDD